MNLGIHYTEDVLSTKMILLESFTTCRLGESSTFLDMHQVPEGEQNPEPHSVFSSPLSIHHRLRL